MAMLGADLGDFVRRVTDPDLPIRAVDRLLLIALALYADPRSGACWPAVGTLAAHMGVDPTTVRDSAKRLEAANLLTRTGQRGGSGTRTWTITLSAVPSPEDAAGDPRNSADGSTSTDARRKAVEARSVRIEHSSWPAQDKLTPLPPGASPAEYTYEWRDVDKEQDDLPGSGEYPGGDSPGGRKPSDDERLLRSWNQAVLYFSYYFADQLIERDLKKRQYRDDAASPEWTHAVEKRLLAIGFPHRVGVAAVAEALSTYLDAEDEDTPRRPWEISDSALSACLPPHQPQAHRASRPPLVGFDPLKRLEQAEGNGASRPKNPDPHRTIGPAEGAELIEAARERYDSKESAEH